MKCFLLLQKITVAECIETQSKAMTMLNIDQLSYLLKFALQKIKQPGVSHQSKCFRNCRNYKAEITHPNFFWCIHFPLCPHTEQTEPFQKPVSLEQHPDYAEYIFHPMDLSTLEKVIFYLIFREVTSFHRTLKHSPPRFKTEYQEENVWLHWSLPGWYEVDLTQLHHL